MSAGPRLHSPDPDSSPRPAARLWLYRLLAAAGLPALLLLGLEGGLRLAGYGRTASFLIPDDQPGFYRSNPDFVSLFLPSNFDLRPLNFRIAARKPANTVRIVVLGESAAQGIPSPAFGFAPQLRAQLRARYPDKAFEVINTGIVAINSHVLYRIACDFADFSPDLFVVYAGNNEVVGPYGPGCAYLAETPPLAVIRLSVFVRSTRTGQLLGALLGRIARRNQPAAEWGGMSMFVDQAVAGDDPRLEKVYRHFETNLEDIIGVAAGAGAKTLLCTVVSNLKDCPPLLSRHSAGFPEAEWQQVYRRGQLEWFLGETAAARADLTEALRLDPHYADTAFMLGSLELEAGDVAAARAHLIAAAHWDALRFRPDARINEIIREVARRHPAAGLVDAALLLGSDPASTVPPAGRELLFEHVHLDWEGNYRVARRLAEGAEAVLFGPPAGPRPWLDSAGCVAALAYTPHERFGVLQRITSIIQNPPFTNQLTYPEDMARLAHDLAVAQAVARDPAALQEARAVALAALARDPDNPALVKIAQDIADDLGDVAGALALTRRAQQLQPTSFALATDEAIKLSRLGRHDEAKQVLRRTAAGCPPRDLAIMAPAFADLYTRTKRPAEGRRHLDGIIALRPADASLRLLRGRLALAAGDTAAAEQEFRAILAADPAQQGALEALVALLTAAGRIADVEKESLAFAGRQPGNLPNNLRAALSAEERTDDEAAARHLLAATRSGPVPSALELRLARKYFALRLPAETLTHLALARRLSLYEGDPAATDSISQVIAKLRTELR